MKEVRGRGGSKERDRRQGWKDGRWRKEVRRKKGSNEREGRRK